MRVGWRNKYSQRVTVDSPRTVQYYTVQIAPHGQGYRVGGLT